MCKIPRNLVSRKQAFTLRTLGFNKPVCYYIMDEFEQHPYKSGKRFNVLFTGYPTNWNGVKMKRFETDEVESCIFTSVPTVYEALDWIATKLEVVCGQSSYNKVGYIYIEPIERDRYGELRSEVDKFIKLLKTIKIS